MLSLATIAVLAIFVVIILFSAVGLTATDVRNLFLSVRIYPNPKCWPPFKNVCLMIRR